MITCCLIINFVILVYYVDENLKMEIPYLQLSKQYGFRLICSFKLWCPCWIDWWSSLLVAIHCWTYVFPNVSHFTRSSACGLLQCNAHSKRPQAEGVCVHNHHWTCGLETAGLSLSLRRRHCCPPGALNLSHFWIAAIDQSPDPR